MRHICRVVLAVVLGVGLWGAMATPVRAQAPLSRYYYYPHYYYPHNYWPNQGPRWPERPGEPYMKPPAYMTFPPFREMNWRYEWLEPQRYYRGSHFWLDQF
jgi:hypothetical protein